MAVKPHGLANRPGEPYPATFRIQWTGRGIEPRSPGCKPGIFPLDEPPMFSIEVRLGIEPSLPPYHSGVQPQHLQTMSDPGWNRTITFLVVAQASSPLDHGINSDRGGSRTHRHEALDLIALPVCVPGH